jgi:hypothetical protein
MLKRLSRIRHDGWRVALMLAWYPFQMGHFAVCMAWNAPRRFVKLEAWVNAHMFYRAGMDGMFVPLE